jgi:hypothetical protein
MVSDPVLIGSVGIVTSGILGPAVAARWARKRQEREFEYDRTIRRNEDLRQVLDDAAVLLGAGVTNLRRAAEEATAGRSTPADIRNGRGEFIWPASGSCSASRKQIRLSLAIAKHETRCPVRSALQSKLVAVERQVTRRRRRPT